MLRHGVLPSGFSGPAREGVPATLPRAYEQRQRQRRRCLNDGYQAQLRKRQAPSDGAQQRSIRSFFGGGRSSASTNTAVGDGVRQKGSAKQQSGVLKWWEKDPSKQATKPAVRSKESRDSTWGGDRNNDDELQAMLDPAAAAKGWAAPISRTEKPEIVIVDGSELERNAAQLDAEAGWLGQPSDEEPSRLLLPACRWESHRLLVPIRVEMALERVYARRVASTVPATWPAKLQVTYGRIESGAAIDAWQQEGDSVTVANVNCDGDMMEAGALPQPPYL